MQGQNPSGRVIAIGDIHGCLTALNAVLRLVEPRSDDLLIVLGDVIDRGPSSRQCVDRLLELRQSVALVHLMGNHEEIFFDALHGGKWSQAWLTFGGQEMLASYGGSFSTIPQEHLNFLRNGKEYWETESHLFVHGNIRAHVPAEQESAQVLRWDRFEIGRGPHVSGKRVICGHSAQKDGVPAVGRHYVCIDTCVYGPEGRLTALDVHNNLFWQADERGQTWPVRPLVAEA